MLDLTLLGPFFISGTPYIIAAHLFCAWLIIRTPKAAK